MAEQVERWWNSGEIDELPDKGEPSLGDLSATLASDVARHPDFIASANQVVQLLTHLRACVTDADLHDFQEELLAATLGAGEHLSEAQGSLRRTCFGKAPQPGAREPATGDPLDPRVWRLERYIANRQLRQLRAVGDALAWVALACDRRIVMAYAGNQPPGPIGKAGLDQERARMEQAWSEGRFAIMNGLTDCLRIDDIIVFHPHGYEPVEVKQPGKRARGAQARRRRQAIDALIKSGPLPDLGTSTLLVDVPVDYATHLDLLNHPLSRANRKGVAALKVPGGRSVVALDHIGESRNGSSDDGRVEFEAARRVAHRRAGISGDVTVGWQSGYRAGRRPYAPPYGIYPVPPEQAARLICDLTSVLSEVSIRVVAEALDGAGQHVEPLTVLDGPGAPVVDLGVPVLRLHRGNMRLDISAANLMLLASELTHMDVWREGFVHILSRPDLVGRQPVVIYANEATSWLGWPREDPM